jgi:hypothetical protein
MIFISLATTFTGGHPIPKRRNKTREGPHASMQNGHLTRRLALLTTLALAACGSEPEPVYEPLRYNYLPPIQLNVAAIDVEQRFFPAGTAPDVSAQDPAPPVEALKTMALDRLQAFGTANKAVFAIQDASLTRDNDVVIGSMAVSLSILDDRGAQVGFAEARVQNRHSGRIDRVRPVLYDMTRAMMADMNVEFEYQIRLNLKDWLTTATAAPAPVEQAPLDQGGPGPSRPMPQDQRPSGPGAPAQGYPAQGYPAQGYPAQGYPAQGYPTQGSLGQMPLDEMPRDQDQSGQPPVR